MNARDRIAADGACTVLLVAAKRRGLLGLEQCWARFTERQRALVPANFLEQLRREAAKEIDQWQT